MFKYSFVLVILTLLISCSREKEPEVVEEEKISNNEIVEPISNNDGKNLYQIFDFEFSLPELFRISESIGPDFTVYYMSYPGGVYGGIYLGQYPDLPSRIDELASKNPMYEEMKTYKGDPFRLNGPHDSLEKNNYYVERFENVMEHPVVNAKWFQKEYQERDFMSISAEEREQYMIRDSFNLEGIKIDSNYIWKSYPLMGKTGAYDVLFTDNVEYGWQVHFFTQVNRFATIEMINEFVDELIESKYTL